MSEAKKLDLSSVKRTDPVTGIQVIQGLGWGGAANRDLSWDEVNELDSQLSHMFSDAGGGWGA